MWIFLPFGFFSIVADPNDAHTLVVRARCREDLEAFLVRLKATEPKALPVIAETPQRDYRFRIRAPRAAVSHVLATFVDAGLKYDNFKAEVAMGDSKRASLYERVWGLLKGALQDGRALAPCGRWRR